MTNINTCLKIHEKRSLDLLFRDCSVGILRFPRGKNPHHYRFFSSNEAKLGTLLVFKGDVCATSLQKMGIVFQIVWEIWLKNKQLGSFLKTQILREPLKIKYFYY